MLGQIRSSPEKPFYGLPPRNCVPKSRVSQYAELPDSTTMTDVHVTHNPVEAESAFDEYAIA